MQLTRGAQTFSFPCFPANLKKLILPQYFNEKLSKLPLPAGLEEIELGDEFNRRVECLPRALKKISFGYEFNRNLDLSPGQWQSNLTHLTLGTSYTGTLDTLPQSLQYLSIGGEFNANIDNLPNSLTVLKFADMSQFDQPLTRLPPRLRIVEFGHYFDQCLDGILPDSLVQLRVGVHFSQQIITWPNKLQTLIISHGSNHRFNNIPHYTRVFRQ